jgi:hypothetical protein
VAKRPSPRARAQPELRFLAKKGGRSPEELFPIRSSLSLSQVPSRGRPGGLAEVLNEEAFMHFNAR